MRTFSKMDWQIKTFEQLSNRQLYLILQARVDVFVVEQQCPYPELDNYDDQAIHLYMMDKDQLFAYARLLPAGSRYQEPSIGRVLVVKNHRGKGYAYQLMNKAIDYMISNWNENTIKIQAQTYLQSFYESFGFQQITEPYLEDDIPHIDMILSKK